MNNKSIQLCFINTLLFLVVFTAKIFSQTKIFVDSSITISGNGKAWSSAYKRLSDALSFANYNKGNYTINVAQGTYLPTDVNGTTTKNRDSSFIIYRKGINIFGGFPAGGGARNSKQYVTRLSGDIGNAGNVDDNLYHVLLVAINSNTSDSLLLDGINIEGGNANSTTTDIVNGISFSNSSGGGIFINNNSGTTINNVYINNCLIQNNNSSESGGGIQDYNCTISMIGSFIYNNSTTKWGAGVNNEAGGSIIFMNDVFANNYNSNGLGGGVRVSGSNDSNQIINCTFTNNGAQTGGAIRVASLGTATLYVHNCIFNGNYSGSDFTSTKADISNGLSDANLSIDFSCIQSNQNCNICLPTRSNPLFTNISNPLGNDGFFGTADDGLTLTKVSPCIAVGNVPIFTKFNQSNEDITGNPRIIGGNIDMGAYEFQSLLSIVTKGSFGELSWCPGSPSSTYNSFLVSGSQLVDSVLVTAPTGFELSLSVNSGFNTSQTLFPSNGVLLSTTIYVRMSAIAIGLTSGNIVVTSKQANTQYLPISGVSNSHATPIKATINGPIRTCDSLPVTFTITTNITDSVKWNWNFGNGDTSLSQNPFPVYFTTKKDIVTTDTVLLVTVFKNCYDTAPRHIITVYPKPLIDLQPQGKNVCEGTTIKLAAFDGKIGGYKWSSVPINKLISNDSIQLVSPNITTSYYVTVTNQFGCINTDSTSIYVQQHFSLSYPKDTFVCVGNSVQLSVSGASKYAWLADSSTLSNTFSNPSSPTATPVKPITNYKFVASDQYGCFNDTGLIKVEVHQFPTLTTVSPIVVVTGDSIQLQTLASPDVVSYQWLPETYLKCSDCAKPYSVPKSNISYTITATTKFGCSVKAGISLGIVCSNSIYFPNAFNTSGGNYSFYPKGKGIRSVKYFRIYNRYGQVVFEKHDMQLNDASVGWDGTFKGIKQTSGTYVYTAEAQCDTGDLIPLQGTIVLF